MTHSNGDRQTANRRTFLTRTGALAVASAFAGCSGSSGGGDGSDGGGGATTDESLPTFENEGGFEVGETFEAVKELAAEEDAATMYATLDREPIKEMRDAFHEKYPDATVEHITGGSEDLGSRWDSEYKTDNPTASIGMWSGKDVSKYWTDEQQVQELSSEFMPVFSEIPDDYKGEKFWVSARLHMASYFYNTDMVSEDDADGWMDIVTNPEWSDQNLGHDPTPNPSYMTWLYNKHGREYFRALADQKPRWVDSHTDLAKLCGAGEFPVAFTYTHKMAEFASELPVDYFKFDPHPGTISPAWISNKAPQPNTAILFLNWWCSAEGQKKLGTTQYLPWHPEAEYEGYPGLVDNDNYEIEFLSPGADVSEAMDVFKEELGGQITG